MEKYDLWLYGLFIASHICERVCACVCMYVLILRKVHYFLFCFSKCSNCPCCSPQALLPCADNCQGFHGTQQQIIDCVLRPGSLWALSSSVILHRAHLAWSRKETSDRNHETLPLEVGIGSHAGETLCCHWSSSKSLWFPLAVFKVPDILFLCVYLSRDCGIRNHRLVSSGL